MKFERGENQWDLSYSTPGTEVVRKSPTAGPVSLPGTCLSVPGRTSAVLCLRVSGHALSVRGRAVPRNDVRSRGSVRRREPLRLRRRWFSYTKAGGLHAHPLSPRRGRAAFSLVERKKAAERVALSGHLRGPMAGGIWLATHRSLRAGGARFAIVTPASSVLALTRLLQLRAAHQKSSAAERTGPDLQSNLDRDALAKFRSRESLISPAYAVSEQTECPREEAYALAEGD